MTVTTASEMSAPAQVALSPFVTAVAAVISDDVAAWQSAEDHLTFQSVPLAQKLLFQLVWLSFGQSVPTAKEVHQFIIDVDEYFVDRTLLFPRVFAEAVLTDTMAGTTSAVLMDDPPLDVVLSVLIVMIAYLVLSLRLSVVDMLRLEQRTLSRLLDAHPALTPWT